MKDTGEIFEMLLYIKYRCMKSGCNECPFYHDTTKQCLFDNDVVDWNIESYVMNWLNKEDRKK